MEGRAELSTTNRNLNVPIAKVALEVSWALRKGRADHGSFARM